MTIITFIIPSIGRITLNRTIQSLQNLNNPNWKAIIIFDGVKSNINDISDNRIRYFQIEKRGLYNRAGLTRNYGINKVEDSIWIGFCDDDDTLSPDYIDKLLIETKYNTDVIVFRMKTTNLIIPPLETNSITRGCVGISFCVKTPILKLLMFETNSFIEDYTLLKRLNKKYSILLSKYITYFIRSNPTKVSYGVESIISPIFLKYRV